MLHQDLIEAREIKEQQKALRERKLRQRAKSRIREEYKSDRSGKKTRNAYRRVKHDWLDYDEELDFME